MAKTITWVRSTLYPDVQNVGQRKRVYRAMTLATDATTGTNTYPAGGVPFTETTNAALAAAFDMGTIERMWIRDPLTQASFVRTTHVGEIDLTNFKLVLFSSGGALVATAVTITGTTIAAATATTLTDSGNGFVTAGFLVGDLIDVQGFTGAGAVANNQLRVVTAVAAGTLTVSGTMIADAAGETVTITAYRSSSGLVELASAAALGDSQSWTALVEAEGY